MSSTCNRCNQSIKWPKPYSPGASPLNEDGTQHSCKNSYEKEEPATINNMPTVKTPNTALEECIVFSETFKDMDSTKFDSLARIYNTLRMVRR